MFRLVSLRSLAFAVCCLFFPVAAHADPVVITNQLNDNSSAFTWTITFSGLPAPGASFVVFAHYINPPIEWGSSSDANHPEMIMSLEDPNGTGVFNLVVLGRHLIGPHQTPGNQDIDPGDIFELDAANINNLGPANVSLDFDVVQHLHFPGAHSDVVQLFGRLDGNNNFTFVVTGLHRDTPVPEPATILLLGTGLSGVVIRLRKRRKRNV